MGNYGVLPRNIRKEIELQSKGYLDSRGAYAAFEAIADLSFRARLDQNRVAEQLRAVGRIVRNFGYFEKGLEALDIVAGVYEEAASAGRTTLKLSANGAKDTLGEPIVNFEKVLDSYRSVYGHMPELEMFEERLREQLVIKRPSMKYTNQKLDRSSKGQMTRRQRMVFGRSGRD